MFLHPRRSKGSSVEITVTNDPWSGGLTCLLAKLIHFLYICSLFIRSPVCFFSHIFNYSLICLSIYLLNHCNLYAVQHLVVGGTIMNASHSNFLLDPNPKSFLKEKYFVFWKQCDKMILSLFYLLSRRPCNTKCTWP